MHCEAEGVGVEGVLTVSSQAYNTNSHFNEPKTLHDLSQS